MDHRYNWSPLYSQTDRNGCMQGTYEDGKYLLLFLLCVLYVYIYTTIESMAIISS